MLRSLYTILLLIPLLAGCTLFSDHETGVIAGGLRIYGGGMLSFTNCDEPCIGMTANADGLNVLYFSSDRTSPATDAGGGTYHIYRAAQTSADSVIYTQPVQLANSEGMREFAVVNMGGVDYIAGMREGNSNNPALAFLRVDENGNAAAINASMGNTIVKKVIALLPPGASLGGVSAAANQFGLIYVDGSGSVQGAVIAQSAQETTVLEADGATQALSRDFISGDNFAGGGSYVSPGVITNSGWLLYSKFESNSCNIYINNFAGTEKRLTAFSETGDNQSPIYIPSENKVYMTRDRDIYRWNRTTLLDAYNRGVEITQASTPSASSTSSSRASSTSSASSVRSVSSSAPGSSVSSSRASSAPGSSASGASSASSAPSTTGKVYIAGVVVANGSYTPGYWVVDEGGAASAAAQWVALDNSTSSTNTMAKAITVDANGDVYAVGNYAGSGAVWKKVASGGAITKSVSLGAAANALCISGDYIYVVGQGGAQCGYYWKVQKSDLILKSSIDFSNAAILNGIQVDANGKIHIVGQKKPSTGTTDNTAPFYYGALSTDTGTSTISAVLPPLSAEGNTCTANAIALGNDGTIHIVGKSPNSTYSNNPTATYWAINATSTNSNDLDSYPFSQAYALSADGGTVFIAGIDTGTAALWKLADAQLYEGTAQGVPYSAYGVCASGSQVYITGYADTDSKAGYWKSAKTSPNMNTFIPLNTSAESYAFGAFYYGG